MIETTTVNGRPAQVAYIGADRQPAPPDQAALIKVLFTDEVGGIAFLNVPTKKSMTTSYFWDHAKRNALARLTVAQRFAIARAEAEQTLARLKVWNEEDHPRAPDGEFTSGGGGGGGDKDKLEGYSDKAKLVDGVIHTSDVYDAVKALSEDRKVELKQPKQVSTLIKKLGEITKEMVEQGEKAPVFDLCKVTINGTNLFCADTKGIPRVKMPQMDDVQTKQFLKVLKGKGYEVEQGKEKSENLRATQNQLDGAKVAKFYKRIRKDPEGKGDDKRLIVSNDDYVLDGHHHWAAQIAADAKDNKLGDHKTKISRVDIDIITLLDEALKFTGGKGAKDVGKAQAWAAAKAEAEQHLKDWDESQHPRVPAGGPDGGQFGSGGGGSSSDKPAGGKDKKKAKKEDFEKAQIRLNVTGGPEGEQKFIDKWNERVGIEPEEFKKQFLGGVDSTMTITGSTGNIEIGGNIQADGLSIGSYSRQINLDKQSAYSAYFKLNSGQTKHNIGKKVLAGNVEMYEKLGVEEVGVTANIDVGGYAWAKYGYVPTQPAWDELRRDLERKLTRGDSRPSRSSRTDTTEAEEWSWIPDDQQTEVRDRWMRESREEFYDSEVDNWRENGQALEDAKRTLADDFNASAMPDYVEEAFELVRAERKEAGEPPIPYSNLQLFHALDAADYSSRYGEGKDDVDLSWNDDELRQPEGGGADPNQQTLPGIEPPDLSKSLTEDMRSQIEAEVVEGFNKKADSDAEDMEPPDYISESVEEYQNEYWDQKDDEERLELAQRYGLADIEIERDEEEEDTDQEPVEPAAPDDPVLDAVRSRDPKSIWKVADSPQGKSLLLGTSWSGKLFLKDKDALTRFKTYVGKAKAA